VQPGKVIVVGAGIVGVSCAYELALRGWHVELIDRATLGSGCSHANCGYICPSHVFPLARPGAIASTLLLIFRRNSPFVIRPRFDPALWAWFARFARACTPGMADDTSVALHALLISAKRRYEEIIGEEKIDCDYQQRGCLFVYREREHLEAFATTNDAILRRFGYGGRLITGSELTTMEPALRDGLAGAWYFDCDAHLRSDRFMQAMRPVLARRGVFLRENCPMLDLTGRDGTARAIATPQGSLDADAFVIATGAWTARLARTIGVDLPIVPGKGYSITSERIPHCPAYPLIFEEDRVAITPFRDGCRIGSMMEFAGFDDSIPARRLDVLRGTARRYLRYNEPLRNEQPWYGWRPMTPDGRPFIDFSPAYRNVVIAAGHNMIGMSTGPGTGRLVAELLTGEPAHLKPEWFRIGR
jgi:D-amino-acid dehydrogenase